MAHLSTDAEKAIGAGLRSERNRLGLSQDELAMRMYPFRWSGSTVSKIESGGKILTAVELFCLVEWVAIDPVALEAGLAQRIRREVRGSTSREAERRAARTLGLPIDDLRTKAKALWGHSFMEERSKRQAPGRSAQDLGHITRRMLIELKAPS